MRELNRVKEQNYGTPEPKILTSDSEGNINKLGSELSSAYFSDPNVLETENDSEIKTLKNHNAHIQKSFRSSGEKPKTAREGECTGEKIYGKLTGEPKVMIERTRFTLHNLIPKISKANVEENSFEGDPNRPCAFEQNDTHDLPNGSENSNEQSSDEENEDCIRLQGRTNTNIDNSGFIKAQLKQILGGFTNQMSIMRKKPIKTDSLINDAVDEHESTPNVLPKSGSVKNFTGLPDTRIIVHMKKNFSTGCKSHLDHINEILKESEILGKPSKRLLEQPKSTSGKSIFSFCSLFNVEKPIISSSDSEEKTQDTFKNGFGEKTCMGTPPLRNRTSQIGCCIFNFRRIKEVPQDYSERSTVPADDRFGIINKSPKSKNKELFSQFKQGIDSRSRIISNCSYSYSRRNDKFSEKITLLHPRKYPCPRNIVSSDLTQDNQIPSKENGLIFQVKHRLLLEGDVHLCHLNHTGTMFSKLLISKFLRRWEKHYILLNIDSITSKTPTGCMVSPLPYSAINEVYAVDSWDEANCFFIRLVTGESSLLLKVNSSVVRDRWLSSIIWKKNLNRHKKVLETSTRPEVILQEIKNLIHMSVNSRLQDDCVRFGPMKIISKALMLDNFWNDRQRSEDAVTAMAPLIEGSTPSLEMFQFFSRHCNRHPTSSIIATSFTDIVIRILKHTVDFGKTSFMRQFVANYLTALHIQSDEGIRKFVKSVHGSSSHCPHPRVLPNMIAVNLSAVFSHYEERKTLFTKLSNETNLSEAVKPLHKQLECYLSLFLCISEYEDWRPGLAQFLQPIPFPIDALNDEKFMEGFVPIMRSIVLDLRCDVHETVLGVRENKRGWLNVFCPSNLACKDDGVLWSQMLETLIACCRRRKGFIQNMVQYLGALLLIALRDSAVAQEILCLMLEWDVIAEKDQEMQVITTLKSTENGRAKYEELCRKREHVKELENGGGLRKLTLPSRSTDSDVARLLSGTSFGNLECLSLAFTHVTCACASYLIQLPKLRYLNLWGTQFGDVGLIVIAEHLDGLQVLNLCETKVSNKGIAAIARMKNLKKLNLNSTKLNHDTFEMLKTKLPELEELDVRYTDAW